MDVNKLILIVYLLTSGNFAAGTDSEAKAEIQCKPYRAYLFLETCSDDETFFTQRNVISQLIDKMPNGSLVHFKLIGATSENTTNIVKDNSNGEWQTIVSSLKPEKECMKPKIQFKYIKGAIEGTRGRHDAQGKATLIFFLLNKDSKIDKLNMAKLFLKDKLTYVMFIGRSSLPFALSGIAADENHEYKLRKVNNIGDLLEVVCKDSRLLCGTTNFWNSKTCESCSFICSSDPSQYCRQECPYYKRSILSISGHSEHVFKETTGNVSKQHINTISIVALILCICTFVFILCCVSMYAFRKRQGKKGTINEQQSLVYLDNENNENNGTEIESTTDEQPSIVYLDNENNGTEDESSC